jgi:hypothetical protein
MASIGTIHVNLSSEVTSTSTSFTEVLESHGLVDGTTYHVVCHALTTATSGSDVFQWRLVDRTNSDTVLSNSTLKREPATANAAQSYSFVGKFTAGSDGGGLAFEQQSVATKTVKTKYLSMMIFDLSNLESSDFFYANDTTAASHSGIFVNRATLTVSEPTSDDTYLMFGWVATDTNKVSNNSEMRMQVTAAGETDIETPFISYEGEDLTEVLNWWICRPYTMTDNSTRFTVQTRDDNVAGDVNEYLESTIFGMRLNAFENFSTRYTDAEDTTTSTDWHELESIAITPDSSGDVNVFADAVFRPQGTLTSSFERLQVDGTTSPNTVPETQSSCRSNDATDYLSMPYVTQYSGVAATSATIDLDAKKGLSSNIGWLNTSISAFTSAILSTAPINYSSVASQAYNSGDVAAQTHNSGDAASESFNSGDVASEVNP